jgi:phosphoglycerate dehydrogenase-like enzyme
LRQRLENDERFEVRYAPAHSEDELIAELGDREVVVTRHYNPLTTRVINAAKGLRLIAQGTTGLDNIDHDAAAAKGITIVDAAGENANAVAELVIAQMISLTRTIPLYHRQMLAGTWERRDCDTRHELRWYRLGIVGIGHVGRRVAKLAAAFGVNAVAYDPYLSAAEIEARGATKVDSLNELLDQATILTLHVPLTEETRGMVGRHELERLAPEAIVINASRGEVIDRTALLERLRAGLLSGVALDVFDPEPPTDLNAGDDSRLILTPHIAGCSFESKASIGEAIYRKICAFYSFEPR